MISLLLSIIAFVDGGSLPAGTTRVNTYLVDRTEIQNIDWQEYVYYQSLRVDSAELQRFLPHGANTSYNDPAMRYQPVVFVTYEQAVEYCIWRSKVVREVSGLNVTYRLPTPEEWKTIAQSVLASDQKQLAKEHADALSLPNKDLVSREKIKDRVYDLSSNVSEMTSEKGVALGGNNGTLTALDEDCMRTVAYEAPGEFIGFRCIAEID